MFDGSSRSSFFFPMCWDGVNLDSADHKSHMSFPIGRVDGGNCPDTHPVRIPGVFFEVLFSVNHFAPQSSNPFRWSCGDPTGYGYHGDFLNGWNEQLVQQALQDPTCDASVTNNGNNVLACNTLAPYVIPSNPCKLSKPIPNIEDLGFGHPITALPGCNPITYGPAAALPCSTITTQPPSGLGWHRFLLQPKTSNLFVTSKDMNTPMTASVHAPYYTETFIAHTNGAGYSIQTEVTGQFVNSAHADPIIANRGSASTWETFTFTAVGNYYAITGLSNNLYISLHPDGTLHADSTSIGDLQLWSLVDPALYPTSLLQSMYAAYPRTLALADEFEADQNTFNEEFTDYSFAVSDQMADNSFDEFAEYSFAVTDVQPTLDSSSTSGSSSTTIPAWAAALIVLGVMVVALLIGVVVQMILLIRKL